MNALRTEYLGTELDNPFLLASAPPTASVNMIGRAFDAGWAGAVTKTIKPDDMDIRDASPRFASLGRGRSVYAFENVELVSKESLAYWESGIRELKNRYPNKMLIASIMGKGGKTATGSWAELALQVQKSGADALELNFSCPHGMPEIGIGAAIGQNPEIVRAICAAVKMAVNIPVIVKITPNVNDVADQAQAALEGGADGLAAINTVESVFGVDLDTLEPLPSVGGQSSYGGMSGKAIKPIGLKAVSRIASVTSLPIMGIGGISDWRDALEYIALGASCVQLCTEVMLHGFEIINNLVEGAESYFVEKSPLDAKTLVGKALAGLGTHEALDKNTVRRAQSDPAICIGCGLCETACADGAYAAIKLQHGKSFVHEDSCDGCGLCTVVCPVGAMSLTPAEERSRVSA